MKATLLALVEEKIRDRVFSYNKALGKNLTDKEPIEDEEAFVEEAMENLIEWLFSLAVKDTVLDE